MSRERLIALSLRWITSHERPPGLKVLGHTPPGTIVEQVACWHRLPVEAIYGPTRSHEIVVARFDAIEAVLRNCRRNGRPLAFAELGRHFGRDHTTIMAAMRKRGVYDSVA